MKDDDEGLLDRAKRALGIGTDQDGDDDLDELGSGPPELGVGLDREGTAGSGVENRGTGLDYDFDERRVSDPEPDDAA